MSTNFQNFQSIMRKSALSKLLRSRTTTTTAATATPHPPTESSTANTTPLLVQLKTFLTELYPLLETTSLSLQQAKERIVVWSSMYQSTHFLRSFDQLDYPQEWKQAIDFLLDEKQITPEEKEKESVYTLQQHLSLFMMEKKKNSRRHVLDLPTIQDTVQKCMECQTLFSPPSPFSFTEDIWKQRLSLLTVQDIGYIHWIKSLVLDPRHPEWSLEEWKERLSTPPPPLHSPPLEELSFLFHPQTSPLPLPTSSIITFCVEYNGTPNFISSLYSFLHRHFLDGFYGLSQDDQIQNEFASFTTSIQRISFWEKTLKKLTGKTLEKWIQEKTDILLHEEKQKKSKKPRSTDSPHDQDEEEEENEVEEEEEESEEYVDTLTTSWTEGKKKSTIKNFKSYPIRQVAMFPWSKFFALSLDEMKLVLSKLHNSSLFSVESYLQKNHSQRNHLIVIDSMGNPIPSSTLPKKQPKIDPLHIIQFVLPITLKREIMDISFQSRPWIRDYQYTTLKFKNKEDLSPEFIHSMENYKVSSSSPETYLMNPILLSILVDVLSSSLSTNTNIPTTPYYQRGQVLHVENIKSMPSIMPSTTLQLVLYHHLVTGEIQTQDPILFQEELQFLEKTLEKYRTRNLSREEFIHMSQALLTQPFCTLPSWMTDVLLDHTKKNLTMAFKESIFYNLDSSSSVDRIPSMIEDAISTWIENGNPLSHTLNHFMDRVSSLLLLTEHQSMFYAWGSVFRKRMRGLSYRIPHLLDDQVLLSDWIPSLFTSLSSSQRQDFLKKWEAAKQSKANQLLFSIYNLFFPGRRTKTTGFTHQFMTAIPSPEEVDHLSFQIFVVQEGDTYKIYPTTALTLAASLVDAEDIEEDMIWNIKLVGPNPTQTISPWTASDMRRFLHLYSPDLLCSLEDQNPHVVYQRNTLYQGTPQVLDESVENEMGVRAVIPVMALEEPSDEQEEEKDLSTTSSMIIPDFFENILRKIQILQTTIS